jgi:hypothetical protein
MVPGVNDFRLDLDGRCSVEVRRDAELADVEAE